MGISVNDANLPEALHVSAAIKRRSRNCRIILGGPGVYFNPEAVLAGFPQLVDYIIRGEAEKAFPELVSRLLGGRERVPERRVINSPRVERMDDYAFPRYEKLNPAEYSSKLGVEYIPVLVGAGCSNQCKYCSTSNFWGHKVRYKSVERVLKEISLLRSIGVSKIELVHDNLFADMGYVARLSEALLRRGEGTCWACSGRADDFDVSVAPLMARAGCRSVFWGIESGSDEGLRKINKRIALEPSVDKVREVAEKHPISSQLSFIYNFPGDDLECFKKTIELAFRLKSEHPEKVQVALNNFLALSGAVFTRNAALTTSRHLIRQLDFGPAARKMVTEAPSLFSFFFKPGNITTLNEAFRLSRMNFILNSFQKTIGLLLEKRELLDILRGFRKSGNVPKEAVEMGRKAGIEPLARLRDVALFEQLGAAPPAGAARKNTYKLLETSYDPHSLSGKRQKTKKRYLFFYRRGGIDTFELTPANFRRFRAAALAGGGREREAVLEIEKYI